MTTQTEFEKAIETANRCNRPNSSDFFIGEFNLTVFAECINGMFEFDKFHKQAFETRIKQLEMNNVKLVEALTLADKVLSLIMIDEAYHEERANIDTIYTMRNDSFKLTKAALPTINLKLTGE